MAAERRDSAHCSHAQLVGVVLDAERMWGASSASATGSGRERGGDGAGSVEGGVGVCFEGASIGSTAGSVGWSTGGGGFHERVSLARVTPRHRRKTHQM